MQLLRPLPSAVLGLLLLLTCDPALARGLNVAVTSKPIHSLVSAVMGETGAPTLIVEGAASPHTFTLKPSGARALFQANIVFRVSEALEPFTRKISRSLPESVTLISLAEAPGVRRLAVRTSATFDAHDHTGEGHGEADHHDHDDDHDGGGADTHEDHAYDPHVWLDPLNAKAMVEEIARALSAADPEDASIYAANAAALSGKIDALDADLKTTLAPVLMRPFIVFHDSMQYFERHFGMAAAGSITVSPELQPSARRLTEVRRKIKALDAACVFAEPQFQPKLVAAVTEGTTARSGTIDPAGQALEPGPGLYFALMQGLARSLVGCLSRA